jgi:ribosome maturation factor RimP
LVAAIIDECHPFAGGHRPVGEGKRLEQDLVPGSYDLEVTSPGADRPLRTSRDFARNVGRDVRLQHAEGYDGPAERTGTLVATTETDITLAIGGSQVTVPLRDVDHGTVVLPW